MVKWKEVPREDSGVYPYSSVMSLYDRSADCEAHSNSFGFGSKERIKYLPCDLRIQSRHHNL